MTITYFLLQSRIWDRFDINCQVYVFVRLLQKNPSKIKPLVYRNLLFEQLGVASVKSSCQTWREKTLRNVPIASIIDTV